MLGTDNDGNFFSLDSSLDIFSENDDGNYDNDSADFPGEAEMNAVTDVNNTTTPALDDWQADLFGVTLPPASAHAAWTSPTAAVTRSTCAPTVLKAIAPARPSVSMHQCHHARPPGGCHCYSIGFLFHVASSSPRRKLDANHPRMYLHCGGLLGDSDPHHRQQLS
eukprot:3548336-Pleurochrysis_carterae.AAC.1